MQQGGGPLGFAEVDEQRDALDSSSAASETQRRVQGVAALLCGQVEGRSRLRRETLEEGLGGLSEAATEGQETGGFSVRAAPEIREDRVVEVPVCLEGATSTNGIVGRRA